MPYAVYITPEAKKAIEDYVADKPEIKKKFLVSDAIIQYIKNQELMSNLITSIKESNNGGERESTGKTKG